LFDIIFCLLFIWFIFLIHFCFLYKFPDKTRWFFYFISFFNFFIVMTLLNWFIKHQTCVHFSFFLHILNHFHCFFLGLSLVLSMLSRSSLIILFLLILENNHGNRILLLSFFFLNFINDSIKDSLFLILHHKPNPDLISVCQFVSIGRGHTHKKSNY